MIRRPPRSTLSSSSAASDVYKRQVQELRPHAVAPSLPFELEGSPAGFPADEREPQELKGLRFIETLSLALGRRMATKLNQPGLVRMERQRELLKSCSHRIEEATCVVLVLEANDQIVGVPHDDHVALGLAPSPAVGPEIKAVVQVDIGKKR